MRGLMDASWALPSALQTWTAMTSSVPAPTTMYIDLYTKLAVTDPIRKPTNFVSSFFCPGSTTNRLARCTATRKHRS